MANTGIVVYFENSAGETIKGDSLVCAENTPGLSCAVDDSPISIHLGDRNYLNAVITFNHHGYIQETQTVSIPNETYLVVYFRVSTGNPIHGSIEGYIYDTSDRPIVDGMVWGIGVDGTTEDYGCVTNSDGFYCLPIISSGDYIISAGKNGYATVIYGSYYQPGDYPTYTADMNFTNSNALTRADFNVDDSGLFVYGRTKLVTDDYTSNYNSSCIDVDTPQNTTVFAKARKFTGSMHKTYIDEWGGGGCGDGTGGSDYEGDY